MVLGPENHPAEEWTSATGGVCIWTPAPGLMVYKLHGHISVASVPAFLRASARFRRPGAPIRSFVDAEAVLGYDSDVRTQVVESSKGQKQEVTTHLLVRSKIVAMGVSVGALMTGAKIVSYADRASFEAACAAAVRSQARRPA